MAKSVLPVNFQDDILNSSMDGRRRYTQIQNTDGTISLEDASSYDQVGSTFGAGQLNATNKAVNESVDQAKVIQELSDIAAVTEAGYVPDALAVKELNNSLAGYSFGYTDDGKPGYREPGADTVIPFKKGIEFVEGGVGLPQSNVTIVTFPVESYLQIIINFGSGTLNQYNDAIGTGGNYKLYYGAGQTINVDDYFDSGKYFSFNAYSGATSYKLVPRG